MNCSTTFTTMGVMDYGSTHSGGGFTKVSGNLLGKKIYLRADADPLWNSASAWGYIGKDFVYTETFDITLKPYHRYVAVVRGEVSAKAFLTGSGRALAHPDDNGYIGINQVKIIF